MVLSSARILALALVIAVAVGILEPVASVTLAQSFPLQVTSRIVSVDGELGFMLDRRLLDHAHPARGSPILYFWLSTNTLSHINGSELRVATLTVGSAQLIYGTILIPREAIAWAKRDKLRVYLKISASPDVGAPAVVSDRSFTLVLDPALTEPMLNVVDPTTGSPQTRFAYYRFFNVSDSVRFNVNLSTLLNLDVRESDLNLVKVHNVTLTWKDQLLYTSLDLDSGLVYTNFLTRGARGSGSQRLSSIEGVVGDFPLLYPEGREEVAGVTVAYQPFNVVVSGYAKVSVEGGLKVERGVVRGVLVRDEWRAPIASLLWAGELRVYPSINNNLPGQLVFCSCTTIHLEARNFKPGVYNVVGFLRGESLGGPYVQLPNTASTLLTIGADGSGYSDSKLPDNPYGGRFVVVTVSLGGLRGPWALGKPGVRVLPQLSIYGFNNTGLPVEEPRFTPGEYILVHGRGWLDIPFTAMTATLADPALNTTVTLEVVDYKGVDANGILGAILKIPVEAPLRNRASLTFNLSSDAYNSYSTTVTVRYERTLVYIQPRPRVLEVTPAYANARIYLGADRYPYIAFWEPEQLRRFTVEVIALPPSASGVTVKLKPLNVPVKGVNVTGTGYLMVEAPVPEVPEGVYQVEVQWLLGMASSSSRFEDSLRVKATAGVLVPVYGKTVVLPSPYDITVKGVGFTPNLRVYYDIPKLGLRNATVLGFNGDIVRADERGVFVGYIPLSTVARAPGTYVLVLHQKPDNGTVSVEVTVTIGAPPPLIVEVKVTPVRFADERVTVWVTAFYGGRVASPAQVSERDVSVTLVVRLQGGFAEIPLGVSRALADKAVFVAEFTPAKLLGVNALGSEILVVVTVTGRYTPESQVDYASSTATLTIPRVTLSDLLGYLETPARILPGLEAEIRRIAGNTDYLIGLQTEQGAILVEGIREILALLSSISGNVTIVKLSLDTLSRNIGMLTEVTLRIEGGVNTSVAKLKLVEGILGNVRDAVISIKGDTVSIRTTDIPGVLKAIASANTTLSRIVVAGLEGLRSDIIGNLRMLSDSLAMTSLTLIGRLDLIQSSLIRLSEATATIRSSLDTITTKDIPEIRSSMESLRRVTASIEDRVVAIDVKMETVRGALGNLSSRSDVENLRRSLVDEIRRALTEITGSVAEVREGLTTTTRNWALANILLSIVAVALLAYTIILLRRAR